MDYSISMTIHYLEMLYIDSYNHLQVRTVWTTDLNDIFKQRITNAKVLSNYAVQNYLEAKIWISKNDIKYLLPKNFKLRQRIIPMMVITVPTIF